MSSEFDKGLGKTDPYLLEEHSQANGKSPQDVLKAHLKPLDPLTTINERPLNDRSGSLKIKASPNDLRGMRQPEME